MHLVTNIVALVLAVSGCLSGCEHDGRMVSFGTTISNSGGTIVYGPLVEFGKMVLDVGVDQRLPPRAERGSFGPAFVPETARLTWINEGLSCEATFEVRAITDKILNFDKSTIYFDMYGRYSRAFVSPSMIYANVLDEGVVPLKILSQKCAEIPNWQRPPDLPSSPEFVDPFKDMLSPERPKSDSEVKPK